MAIFTSVAFATDPEEVEAYFTRYPDLAEFVPSVVSEVKREFGYNTEMILGIYQDPEISDSYVRLNLRLPSYDEHTMERIDRVTERFDEALCKASGYLLVTTDYQPAKPIRYV
jgi:hypothetical protein